MLNLPSTPAIKIEIPGEAGEDVTKYKVDVMIRIRDKQTHALSEKQAASYEVAIPNSKLELKYTEFHQDIQQSVIETFELDTEMFEVRIHIDTIERIIPKAIQA